MRGLLGACRSWFVRRTNWLTRGATARYVAVTQFASPRSRGPAMTIDCAFFGFLAADADARTSKAGKPWVRPLESSWRWQSGIMTGWSTWWTCKQDSLRG